MKDENAFNGMISKQLKRFSPDVAFLKASDKFTIGVSDFILWGFGRSMAVESKYVAEQPSDRALLLKHEFSGAQLTFMETITLTGNQAYGLVGVGDRSFLLPYSVLPKSGNWQTREFMHLYAHTIYQISEHKIIAEILMERMTHG